MTRLRMPVAILAGDADELEAQFYEALRNGQLDRLMALWADDDEIVCVLAGGPRLIGAAQIRAGFEAAIAAGRGALMPEQVHRVQVLGASLHHLVERRHDGTCLLASNLYVKTAAGWRLAAHHASVAPDGSPAAAELPGTLH